MPWTFAHPAAVLWLRGHRAAPLSFLGLVAGSMAPDAGYYVGRFDVASAAHTLLGLLTVCLPVGLVLVGFLDAMRSPLANLMPQPHRGALLSMPQAPRFASLSAIWWTSVSVVVGALTHIVWDSFTHQGGVVVSHSSLLQHPVFRVLGKDFHLFNVLQHVSTLLGVTVIVVAYGRWLRVAAHGPSVQAVGGEAWRYWPLAFVAVASLVTAGLFAAAAATGETPVPTLVVQVVFDSTAIFAILVTAAALLLARRSDGA
jgi:hypothetical protein